MKDEAPEIRIAAAYAIGQTGNEISEIPLINAITREEVPLVINRLLEALGKCISQQNLYVFEDFNPSDSLEKAGLAWGIYRAGIRGIYSSTTINQSIGFIDIRNSYQTRLGAANFLMRTRDIKLNNYLNELQRSLITEPAPSVRMAIARSIGKIDSLESVIILSSVLKNDPDYRVRTNAILALASLNFKEARNEIITSLTEEHINVKIVIAEFLSRSNDVSSSEMFELCQVENRFDRN